MAVINVTNQTGWKESGDNLVWGSGSTSKTYYKVSADNPTASVLYNGVYYSVSNPSSESASASAYPTSKGIKHETNTTVYTSAEEVLNDASLSNGEKAVFLADVAEAYNLDLSKEIRQLQANPNMRDDSFSSKVTALTSLLSSEIQTYNTFDSYLLKQLNTDYGSESNYISYTDVTVDGLNVVVTCEVKNYVTVPAEATKRILTLNDRAEIASDYDKYLMKNGDRLLAMSSSTYQEFVSAFPSLSEAKKHLNNHPEMLDMSDSEVLAFIKKRTSTSTEAVVTKHDISLTPSDILSDRYSTDGSRVDLLNQLGVKDEDIVNEFLNTASVVLNGENADTSLVRMLDSAINKQALKNLNSDAYGVLIELPKRNGSGTNDLTALCLTYPEFGQKVLTNGAIILMEPGNIQNADLSSTLGLAISRLKNGVSYDDLTDEQKQAIAEAGGPQVGKKYKKPYRPDHFHMQFGGDNIMNAGGVGEEGRAYYSIWDTPVKALNYFTSDKSYPVYCGINSRYTSSGSGISYHAAAFAFTITQPSKVSFIWHYRRLNNRPGSGPFRWRIVPWQENDPVRKYNGVNWSGSTHGWLDAARKVKSTIWNINHYGTEFYEDANGKVRARPSKDFIDGGQFYYNGSNKKVKDNDPSVSGDMEITAVVDAQHFNLGVIYPDAIDGHSQNDMDKYVRQHCVSGSQYNVTFSCRDIGEIVETRATFTCSDIEDSSTWRWETVEGYPEIPRRFAIVVYPPYYANDNKRYQYFDVQKLNLGYTQNYCSINYTDEPDNIIDFYHMPHEDRHNTVCYGVQGRNRSPANLLIYGGSEPYYGNGISTYICTNTTSGRKYLPYEMYIHNGSGITEYWNYIDADTTVDANVGYTYDEAQYYYQVHKLNPREIDLRTIQEE